tara:strand:- start:170 stop:2344 length:2175 start_codon:yes stop_codon:yes gene_type:complete
MAWTGISNTVPQYEENGIAASGFYIKFYASGTVTPIPMAIDSTGVTTLAKCLLSTEGYPLNGSSAVFIPHIDQLYKIILYRNATDADADTTANAAWVVDALNPVLTDDLIFANNYQAIRDLISPDTTLYARGKTTIGDGGEAFFQKKTGSPGTYTDDNNKTLVPTAGDGSVGWVRSAHRINHPTIAALVADTRALVGMKVTIDNYTATNNSGVMFGEIVAAGTGTPDGGSYIDLVGSTGQFKQNLPKKIHATLFGMVGDGVANDTTILQAALDYAGKNQTISIDGARCLIDTISIPMSINLTGSKSFATSDNYTLTDYTEMQGTLLLNVGATVNMGDGTNLVGIQILPAGMVFPQPDSSTWVGTAITVIKSNGISNTVDAAVTNCLVVGFDRCLDASKAPRLICDNLNFDCQNGIKVDTAGDPIKFTKCHGWPFGTLAHPTGGGGQPADPGVRDRRSGIAYEFLNNADAGKLSECFSFAYALGFKLTDVNGLTMVNCGSDNYNLFAPITSTGMTINGACGVTVLNGCQFVAHVNGIDMSSSADVNVLQVTGGLIGINTEDIHIILGTVILNSVTLGAATRAVGMFGGTNRLVMDNCTLQGITGEVVLNNAGSPNVFIGPNNITQDIAGIPMYSGVAVAPTVPSAATTVLGGTGEMTTVTGTTGIFGFSGGWPGRRITLRFEDILTLSDAAGMALAGNFVTSTNDTLTLVFTSATQCYEIARSVN